MEAPPWIPGTCSWLSDLIHRVSPAHDPRTGINTCPPGGRHRVACRSWVGPQHRHRPGTRPRGCSRCRRCTKPRPPWRDWSMRLCRDCRCRHRDTDPRPCTSPGLRPRSFRPCRCRFACKRCRRCTKRHRTWLGSSTRRLRGRTFRQRGTDRWRCRLPDFSLRRRLLDSCHFACRRCHRCKRCRWASL